MLSKLGIRTVRGLLHLLVRRFAATMRKHRNKKPEQRPRTANHKEKWVIEDTG